MTTPRNALGPAYDAAEAAYDNVSTIINILDAWSRPGRASTLSPEALAHLRHNLLNAQDNLECIYLVLRTQAEAAIAAATHAAALEMIAGDNP